MNRRRAQNVSTSDAVSTPDSLRYSLYWPRTTSRAVRGRIDRKTFTFSLRSESAPMLAGGSIASNCTGDAGTYMVTVVVVP